MEEIDIIEKAHKSRLKLLKELDILFNKIQKIEESLVRIQKFMNKENIYYRQFQKPPR